MLVWQSTTSRGRRKLREFARKVKNFFLPSFMTAARASTRRLLLKLKHTRIFICNFLQKRTTNDDGEMVEKLRTSVKNTWNFCPFPSHSDAEWIQKQESVIWIFEITGKGERERTSIRAAVEEQQRRSWSLWLWKQRIMKKIWWKWKAAEVTWKRVIRHFVRQEGMKSEG